VTQDSRHNPTGLSPHAPQGPSSGDADPWGERLPRSLGVLSATAIVIGSTIGSGIFRTPAEVARRIDTLWLFCGAWVLGSVVALCGALAFAELSAMMPRSGGIYVYLRRAFGPLPAFLFGWAQLLVLRPASYGAIAVTSSAYLARTVGIDPDVAAFFGGSLSRAQVGAIALIVLVGMINYSGAHWGALVQNVSTVIKLLALAVLVVLGMFFAFAMGEPAVPATYATLPSEASGSGSTLHVVTAFGLAMVPVLWSYDGWSDVGYISGEVRDPQRTLPRAFVLGTAIVGVAYLSVNAAYLFVIPLAAMPGSELIAADVAEAIVGSTGVVFVSAAVGLSTLGTLNGTMMTGPRILYAMAEDGLFFRGLAQVHPRFGTPGSAILLSIALGSIFVSVRTFSQMADLFVIGIWPFYALGVLALFRLRATEPEHERPYRTWGYPWVPAIFLAAAVFVLLNYLVAAPGQFFGSVGVILLGIPAYGLWSMFRPSNGSRPSS